MSPAEVARSLSFLTGLAAFGLPLVACNRAEPDGSSPTNAHEAAAKSVAAATHGERPAPRAPACLEPLPEMAPPKASRASTCPPDPGDPGGLGRGWVTFADAPGAPRVTVEIAESGGARERGLMYRTSMPEDQGMIFSWTEEAPRTFWMHNTCIPLDMLFIAKDGTILGVREEVPVLNDAPRGVRCPAAHVLEVNAGYVRAHGIAPGQHVRVER